MILFQNSFMGVRFMNHIPSVISQLVLINEILGSEIQVDNKCMLLKTAVRTKAINKK